MKGQLKALHLSHKQAPIEIRELVALSTEESVQLLNKLKEYTNLKEVLVISTCNRTAFYYLDEQNRAQDLLSLLSIVKGIPQNVTWKDYFVHLDDDAEALNHLFRVSVGLEAQIIGDIQIANQIKRAYQHSCDADMAGPYLHRLMHTIFYSNKRVVQETAFRDGAASVSYAATELVHVFAEAFREPTILLLGLGEIGKDLAKNLIDSQFRIQICNRTEQKALDFTQDTNFEAIPFESLDAHLPKADIIVSSIQVSKPFITKEKVQAWQKEGLTYFIDLSVPRSIAEEIDDLPGCSLHNVDQIKTKASKALSRRKSSIPDVERIIDESATQFNHWADEMIVSPVIQKFKHALEQIRKDELAKHMKHLSDKENQFLEQATKNMLQKIIKLPVIQLKAACKRGEAESLIGNLSALFDLEEEVESKNMD